MTKLPGVMGKRLHLRYVGLEPRTLRAYRLALQNFLQFAKKKSFKFPSPKRLDHVMNEFINDFFQEGDPISYAGHLLSAFFTALPELGPCLYTQLCSPCIQGLGGSYDSTLLSSA